MPAPWIVVGAGSSGAVVARRLTERPDREVLLVEAGPDYLPADLPSDLADGTRNSMHAHDWGYRHKPSREAMLSPLPRGRVVGGSSAVNTCIALRGQPEDYDEWAALGLDEWTFERCLPAFKRLERDLDFSDDFHGTDGPLPVRRHRPEELVPFQRAFIDACAELGLPKCADSNAPHAVGYGPHAMNKLGGRRISVAEAYLSREVRARPNLAIRANTLVRRVLFSNRRVTGIELSGPRGVERLDASRVVLSAGALNTPGILLRSGVGPDADVRRLAVEPVLDAPAVGRRLLDHPGTGIFVLAKRGVSVDRTAPIIQTGLRQASGLVENPADVLIQAISFTMIFQRLPLFALVAQVGKPYGHGSIRYESAAPDAKPVIDNRFFEDATDRRVACGALARCRELLETRALSSMGTPVLPWRMLLKNDALLDRAVRVLCDSGYHPCGTVPMGRSPGVDAAVDGRGRVFGLDGLFVADASLFPTIPSSNIHLPTLMTAERMAEWLRDEI
ncbi:MAG TPA: GMC family oxidoreductase N-terminal domain-containing protein [Polyangiaceae bacterium]|nr:GMC family oxidoreductase N-terminal domain-containing protein [Polyangiaceae bacterium]